jgi:hypothetical protein
MNSELEAIPERMWHQKFMLKEVVGKLSETEETVISDSQKSCNVLCNMLLESKNQNEEGVGKMIMEIKEIEDILNVINDSIQEVKENLIMNEREYEKKDTKSNNCGEINLRKY